MILMKYHLDDTMSLIKKNTDYAIRALCFMAGQSPCMVSAAVLAERLGISWSLTRRILQELTREGYIQSFRGKGGGFVIGVPPHEICVIELIRIFQGALQFNKCLTSGKPCSNLATCALRRKVSEIENHVVSELESLTIASLLEGKRAAT